MLSLHQESLDARSGKFTLFDGPTPCTWNDLLEAWTDPNFATLFSMTLADQPHHAFRWECPGLTIHERDSTCEFVVVDDPSLDRKADKAAFTKHFGAERTATFTNLGGDATLVVPSDADPNTNYTHLASFLRTSRKEQQVELWAAVAAAVEERLSDQRVWLSTAGGGVPWLHVRLDNRPKYYSHEPYRT